MLQSLHDIIKGYSKALYNKRTVYIKHFSLLDQAEFEKLYNNYYERAKLLGIHTEKEMLAYCIKEKLWFEEKEKEIFTLGKTIESLESHKKRIILESQLDATNTRIENERKKLNKILLNRSQTITHTCEIHASEKMNNHYIYKAFFLDCELKNGLFSEEDFEELTKDDLLILVSVYNDIVKNYYINEIKKIAVSNLFQNFYHLCNDNVYDFFGKPIIELTSYQTQLMNYGKYFKSLLSDIDKIPIDVAEDPEKLVDYVEMSKNREKNINQNKNKNVAIIGGAKKDLESINKDYELDDTHKKVLDSGKKSFNMRDLLASQTKK